MPNKSLQLLGGLTAQSFLEDYWQKAPLLIRNGLPDIEGILEPDELAGLALEEEVESRLLIERSPIDWEVRNGPFTEKTFTNLPKTHWSLLVQAVDHQVPAVSELLEAFSFIPHWRIEDIMVSFAPQGGSVGPHYDYYDVFLIQAYGQRRWKVGQHCDEKSPVLPNIPVRILKEFDTQSDWILNPGDILYLPPGVAHHGVAENDCMTFSVGFRAPSHSDLLNEFTHFLSEKTDHDQRFQDPNLKPQQNPGWLSEHVIDQIQSTLQSMVADKNNIANWFAGYVSQTKYQTDPESLSDEYDEPDVLSLLHENTSVRREESSRFIYLGEETKPTAFFVNGQRLPFSSISHTFIQYLCGNRVYDSARLYSFCRTEDNLTLFTHLLNRGVIYIEDNDED